MPGKSSVFPKSLDFRLRIFRLRIKNSERSFVGAPSSYGGGARKTARSVENFVRKRLGPKRVAFITL